MNNEDFSGDPWGAFDELADLITRENAFDVANEYYPANKLGNAEFARDLADATPYRPGQTDKQHYQAALRNVERWRQGTRQPGKASLDALVGILQQKEGAMLLALDMMEYDGWELEVDGDVEVSEDTRSRHFGVFLNVPDLAKIGVARSQDNPGEVARVILEAYGIRSESNSGDRIHMAISPDAEMIGSAVMK